MFTKRFDNDMRQLSVVYDIKKGTGYDELSVRDRFVYILGVAKGACPQSGTRGG